LVGLTSLFTPARAETDFGQVAIYVAHMLENTHYSEQEFDNGTSAKLLENYPELPRSTPQPLHPGGRRLGFRAEYKDTLDDLIMLRDISPGAEDLRRLQEARA